MKPLLSRRVRRGQTVNEWEPSEHQSTLDGLRAFAERQEARRRLAQNVREPEGVVELRPTIRRRERER